MYAAKYNWCAEIFRVLLDNGADINAVNVHGRTPLIYATCYFHLGPRPDKDVMQLLLGRGADVTVRDKDGKNALDYIKIHFSYTDAYKLLREKTLSVAPESKAAEPYMAYYEILKAAIDKYPVHAWRHVSYAELINFGDDGLPSLLYVISYDYHGECYIYSYSEGKAELLLLIDKSRLIGSEEDVTVHKGYGAGNIYGFEIATNNNGVKYLRVFVHWKELGDEYYTVKNGEWIEALTREYNLNSNGYVDWYVNGNLAEKNTYDSAPETELGIVDTRETPDNPDAVYAVLAELAEKAGVVTSSD